MRLIADSGGTTTDWALVTGQKIRFFSSMGLHPDTITPEVTVPEALRPYQKKVTRILFYGSGCARTQKAAKVKALMHKWFPAAVVQVFSDLMAIAHTGLQKQAGIVAVLGTGSSMAIYDGKNLQFPVKSPGKYSDPGSGTDLGMNVKYMFEAGKLPPVVQQELSELTEKKQLYTNDLIPVYTTYIMNNLHEPVFKQLCTARFNAFFDFYRPVITNQKPEIVCGGTIAWLGKNILAVIAARRSYHIKKIIRKPINLLVQYNCDTLFP